MDINDALKSIIVGLKEQTEMGKIDWIDESKIAKAEPDKYKYHTASERLSQTLYYRIDKDTIVEAHFEICNDHTINYSWLNFENKKFQGGRLMTGSKMLPGSASEYLAIENVLFDKYIAPNLKKSSKSIITDTNVLIDIASKCGQDVVRDMKLNSILNKDEDKPWFKKIF